MAANSLPPKVISNIISEIEYGTKPGYTRVSDTLKRCSLLSRDWTYPAQHHLLRKLVFADPREMRGDYPSLNRSHRPNLEALLAPARKDPSFLSHIRILSVSGSSYTSNIHFPEILNLIAKAGQLRTLTWKAWTVGRSVHDPESPDPLTLAIEALLNIPSLTSLRLLNFCERFPTNAIGSSPLKYLELDGPSNSLIEELSSLEGVKIKILKLTDDAAEQEPIIRKTYTNWKDVEILDELTELRIDGFHDLGIVKGLCCATITTLTWTYTRFQAGLWDSAGNPGKLPFKRLVNLRILNIEAPNVRSYMWLNNGPLPKSLETINITIRHSEDPSSYDPDDPAHIHDQDRLHLSRLEKFLMEEVRRLQSSDGPSTNLREINMYHPIQGYTEALRQTRREAEVYMFSDPESKTDRGKESRKEFEKKGRAWRQSVDRTPEGVERKKRHREILQWGEYGKQLAEALREMNRPKPWLDPDDKVAEECLARCANFEEAKEGYKYISWKYLPETVEARYTELQSTGIFKCFVLDYDDMPLMEFDREIWGIYV